MFLKILPCITCCKFDNVLALFCHPFFSMIKTQESTSTRPYSQTIHMQYSTTHSALCTRHDNTCVSMSNMLSLTIMCVKKNKIETKSMRHDNNSQSTEVQY